MSMIWLILLVLSWGLLHSLLASIRVKDWFRRLIGPGAMRFYRLGYNLFSVLSFLPLPWLMAVLPDRALYAIPFPWVLLSAAGRLLALLLLAAGVLQTGLLSFIGLQQIFEGEQTPGRLVTGGLYRYVRHPLYMAGLIFVWLTPVMTVNLLAMIVAASAYLVVGAYFEERKLLREYGVAYAEYRAATPMFAPLPRWRKYLAQTPRDHTRG